MIKVRVFQVEIAEGNIKAREAEMATRPTSLDQASNQLPVGVYSTFRTYFGNRALYLDKHFDRVEQSAGMKGFPTRIDRIALRSAIRSLLTLGANSDVRVRIILAPDFPSSTSLFLLFEPLTLPTEQDKKHGVRVLTKKMYRENPLVKASEFIKNTEDIRQFLKGGINEIVMVDGEERYLEGLSSNFYAVLGDEIWTAGSGVLPGITQSMLLEIIKDQKIPLILKGLPTSMRMMMTEAFLTSTSRGILPVTWIDQQPVADGKPGHLTMRLMELFDQKVEKEVKPI